MSIRELAPVQAVRARLRHRDAEVVPFRKARMRIDGKIDGGGRLEVGYRWPGAFYEPTTFIVDEGGRCTVNDVFKIAAGGTVVVGPGAHLDLKGGMGINTKGTISCFERLTIGVGAYIGPEVLIRDSDSHSTGEGQTPSAPVTIGDNVWVGVRAIILKGVTIGDGAVIGAGSIVTKDVESHTLVAGSPARFIRAVDWTP